MAALLAVLIALAGLASPNFYGSGPPGAPVPAAISGNGPPGAPVMNATSGNGPPGAPVSTSVTAPAPPPSSDDMNGSGPPG